MSHPKLCAAGNGRQEKAIGTEVLHGRVRNPRTDKWPYWGRALEQSRAELENGREREMTRSYSSGRSYSR
jgi:hypothetical protein